MDRDHAIHFQHQSLTGFTEHIDRTDNLQLLRPERSHKGWVKDRDMIHRNQIRFAIGNIFFSSNSYTCQRTKDAAENKLGTRSDDFEAKRNMIYVRVTHLTKASICSKTSSAVSLSESSTTASSAAFNGAT